MMSKKGVKQLQKALLHLHNQEMKKREKKEKALAASVTGIVSPEEESAIKAKEAQKERGVKPGGCSTEGRLYAYLCK